MNRYEPPSHRLTHRQDRFFSSIRTAPYLALVLVLLVAFMCGPVMPNHTRGPALAYARSAKPAYHAIREDSLCVSITRDGSLFFRNYKMQLDVLADRLHNAVLNGAEKRVYLAIDGRAHYGDVKPVLDQVQLAGLQDITILTE